MKYTSCKWNKGAPKSAGTYICVYTIPGCGDTKFAGEIKFTPGDYSNILYWSEIPSEPTDEELDREEFKACPLPDFNHHFGYEKIFLAGCKSARERMKRG